LLCLSVVTAVQTRSSESLVHRRQPHHQSILSDSNSGLIDSNYSRLPVSAITGGPSSYYGGNGSLFRTTQTGNSSLGSDIATGVYFQASSDLYRPTLSTPAAAAAVAASGIAPSLLSTSSVLAAAAATGYYEKCST